MSGARAGKGLVVQAAIVLGLAGAVACAGAGRGGADAVPAAEVGVVDEGPLARPDACEAPEVRDADAPPPYDAPPFQGDGACDLSAGVEGRFYRFARFDVDRPAGPEGALASTLTALWAGQIADEDLNIIYHVVRHDLAAGEMEIEAGTAVKLREGPDAGRFRMVSDPPPGRMRVRLDGCRFWSTGPGELNVFPDLLAVPIAILDAWTQGEFSPDGSSIAGGWLAGGICTLMAMEQYFKPVKGMEGCTHFFSFLSDLGVHPDRDDLPCGACSGSGYTFVGRFDAVASDAFVPEAAPAERTFRCD